MIEPDDKLKNLFDEAVKVARQQKHEYITLEHLLLTILNDPEIKELCQKTDGILYADLIADLQN